MAEDWPIGKQNVLFCREFPKWKTWNIAWGSEEKNNLKMIRVISCFADGPVNFNPTGLVEDQTQKLISSTEAS